MAENGRKYDIESFALGMVVAALLYLIFRHEIARLFGGVQSALSNLAPENQAIGSGGPTAAISAAATCGCGIDVSNPTTRRNENVIPIGGQSYAPNPSSGYSQSQHIAPSTNNFQWFRGQTIIGGYGGTSAQVTEPETATGGVGVATPGFVNFGEEEPGGYRAL